MVGRSDGRTNAHEENEENEHFFSFLLLLRPPKERKTCALLFPFFRRLVVYYYEDARSTDGRTDGRSALLFPSSLPFTSVGPSVFSQPLEKKKTLYWRASSHPRKNGQTKGTHGGKGHWRGQVLLFLLLPKSALLASSDQWTTTARRKRSERKKANVVVVFP